MFSLNRQQVLALPWRKANRDNDSSGPASKYPDRPNKLSFYLKCGSGPGPAASYVINTSLSWPDVRRGRDISRYKVSTHHNYCLFLAAQDYKLWKLPTATHSYEWQLFQIMGGAFRIIIRVSSLQLREGENSSRIVGRKVNEVERVEEGRGPHSDSSAWIHPHPSCSDL